MRPLRSAATNQPADELQAVSGSDLRHVSAAAVRAPGELDDVRAQGQQQLVKGMRVLTVLPAVVVVRARDEAADVGSQLEALEVRRTWRPNSSSHVIEEDLNRCRTAIRARA